MNPVVAYLAGLFTLPVLAMLGAGISWAFAKDSGTGKCLVEGCRFKPLEPGEHFNVTVKAEQWRHRLTTGRKHRKAVIAYWQDRKDRGLPVNPYAERYLK